MKRVIAVIINIILILNLPVGALAAQGGKITFEVARTEVVDGYADVVVNITENDGVAGFTLDIEYDSEILMPRTVVKGSVITGGTFAPNPNYVTDEGKGCVRVVWFDTSNMKKTGDAFTIRFSLIKDNFGESEIKLSAGAIADQNYKDLDVTLIDGVVVSGEVTPEQPPAEEKKSEYTISKLSGDASMSRFSAEITLTKNAERDVEDYIIIAVYSEGALYDIYRFKAKGLLKGQETTFNGSMLGCEGAVMKAFVWNSLSGMASLSNVVEN